MSLPGFTAEASVSNSGALYAMTEAAEAPANEGVVTPQSPAAYFSCMFGCVGVTCARPAAICMRIPNLPAALACVAGFCGFRAYRCHGTCRRAW